MDRRRALLSLIEYRQTEPSIPNNQIWYTSSNGKVVTPYKTNVFGANISSNTYTDGMGIITFDGDVTMIGDLAFYNLINLTNVTIPNSVTTIGNDVFGYCHSLTNVTIPNSVTSIGVSVFNGCYSLKEFKGKFADEDGRSLIVDNTIIAYAYASGNTYNIPNSVTTIEEYTFSDCDNLISVNIPDSVTTIGEGALCYCNSLTSVNIPNSVTSIRYYAFQGCTSLTSVTIGNNVKTIGDYAFDECTSLTSVYCKAITPPTLSYSNVFDNNGSGRKIYVPVGSVNAYKSATRWSEYADAIVGYNF